MKKILITAGGTGGHVYPAMALAKQLLKECGDLDLLFVGGGLKSNRYFDRDSFSFQEVPCGTFHKNPLVCARSMGHIAQGVWQSTRIIKAYKPDLVVGFGSFYTLPTLLSAKLQNIPIILHEANRIPGKVNRLLSKYVALTGVHFPDTGQHLKGNTCQASIPLREGYKIGVISPAEARNYFQLDPDLLTLLVFGGSQGARAINQLFFDAAISLPASIVRQLQVLHITGDSVLQKRLQDKYTEHGIKACVKVFETRMDMAWRAADLMVSRAGAGTVAEQLEFEVPGILIPFPHAADNHQEKNADFMVESVKGAVKCLEHNLATGMLGNELLALLSEEQKRLKGMKQSMQEYKLCTPSHEFCKIILDKLS